MTGVLPVLSILLTHRRNRRHAPLYLSNGGNHESRTLEARSYQGRRSGWPAGNRRRTGWLRQSAQQGPATVAESKHAWEVIPDSITDIASVEDFDIVVVGAGIAGVIAAQSAAEAGAKVVLVEKTDSISARGHDIGAVNTKAHKAEGIVINPAQVRDDYAQLTGNKTDMNLFNIWLEHSGECVDYYIDMMDERGVPHIIAPVNEAILAQTSPCLKQYMTGIDFIDQPGKQKTDDGENINHRFVRLIFEYGLKLGVDARFNTKAEQLIREGSGPVTGVIVSTEDGQHIQLNASKGVILATGGIDGNEDMMETWAPLANKSPDKIYPDVPGNTGDGILMGMWVGAARQKGNAAGMALPSFAAKIGGPLFAGDGSLGWLNVNLNGMRYANEICSLPMGCYSAMCQPQAAAYSIYDGDFKEKLLAQNPSGLGLGGVPQLTDDLEEKMATAKEQGFFFEANTIEELAEAIGAPADTLKSTIAHYNEMCAKGVDEDYNKPAQYLTTIETPPFYASRVKCALLVCCFGLNVDSYARVCDGDDEPIEGLYAIGNVMGNMFTDSYPMLVPGISHGRCVTFGRLLGQALATGKLIGQ